MLSIAELLSYLLTLVGVGNDSSDPGALNKDDAALIQTPGFSIGLPWFTWTPRLQTTTLCPVGCPFNRGQGRCSCPRALQPQTPFDGATVDASGVISASIESITGAPNQQSPATGDSWISLVPPACTSPCVWSVVNDHCDCHPTKAAHDAAPQRTHIVVFPDVTAGAAMRNRVADEL